MSIIGLSPSDFVLAISVVTNVVSALKDDKAASEYADIAQFLQNLCMVLRHLQDLSRTSHVSPAVGNALLALSATAERPLREFIADIEKFGRDVNSDLSCRDPRRTLMRGVRKLEWAFLVRKKVDVLRARIAAEMSGLQILLGSRIMWVETAFPMEHYYNTNL